MKHKITEDIVYSFKSMLQSKDKGDINLATDILENRDTDDPETRENFKKILNEILDINQSFLGREEVWCIKIKDKILRTSSGKSSWTSKANASKALSYHIGRVYFNKLSFKGRRDMLRHFFKDTKALRKFLEENNSIEIVKLG